jgi:hypothetical protein
MQMETLCLRFLRLLCRKDYLETENGTTPQKLWGLGILLYLFQVKEDTEDYLKIKLKKSGIDRISTTQHSQRNSGAYFGLKELDDALMNSFEL